MMTEQNSPKDLNSLNSLSETWHEIRLMDHFSIATGNTPPSSHKDSYGGEFLFAGPGDLGKQKYIYDTEKKINSSALKYIRKFPKGSTLFTCIGSTIGKTGLAVQEMTSNQQINAVFPNHQDNCEFIYYALTYRAPIIKLNAGHQAVPIINKNEFGQTLIKVPKSASEQIKIATALSDTDALISELEKLIEKKQAIKTATMQQLLTGKTRLPEFALREDGTPKAYKNSELGQIPEDWDVYKVGEISDVLTGFPFPSSHYTDSGVRLLRGSNVKRGVTDWSEDITQYWPIISSDIKKYELKVGDIVISMDGSLVGRSFAQLDKSDLPAVLLQRVARVRSSDVDQNYLKQWICSEMFTAHCDAVKTVTAIPHISPDDIKTFRFVAPKCKKEQKQLSGILKDMEVEIQILNEKLTKLIMFKKGMMQELLTGKTRLV